MHVVHKAPMAQGGFQFAVIGVMFDTYHYTAKLQDHEREIIDAFFDAHLWDIKEDVISGHVPLKELMEMMDTKNRYEYKGSLTTPPLSPNVHWNVLSTVYPISPKHFKQYLNQQKRNTT